MTRPHIDYLQSQTLGWTPASAAHLAGCQMKLLSEDAARGAQSLLVRYPAGWTSETRIATGTTEELFVLDGAVDLDGRRYGQDCYGYFDGGRSPVSRSSPDGAVALMFYGDVPRDTLPAVVSEDTFVDAYELDWTQNGLGGIWGGQGVRWKRLQGTGATTSSLLIALPAHRHPHHWVGRQQVQSDAEELFLLSGDLLSPRGQLWAGGYSWWPAGTTHGPFGTRGGNLILIRSHGPQSAAVWTSHEIELPRAPDYQPVLPAELSEMRFHAWRPLLY